MSIVGIKQKAIRGGLSLLVRQAILHSINILGNIILARILLPEDFGVYVVILFFINIFFLCGNGGLGAYLIQCGEEPTPRDYQIIFSFQLIFTIILVIVGYFASPLILRVFGFQKNTVWMFKILVLTLMLAPFRGISVIRLERHLVFDRVAFGEIIEALLFQATTIALASLGYRVWSFIWGAIIKNTLGPIIIFFLSPWRIGITLDLQKIKTFMKFGLPYQGVPFISLIKDSINPILIGTVVGATAVGLVNWANSLAGYPILVVFVLNRIFFPTFSRLKNDPEELRKVFEKTIKWNNILVFGFLAVLIAHAPDITTIVFGVKWKPAIPLIYLFSFGTLFVSSLPIMALLNALKKSNIYFYYSLIWMVCIWVLGYPLVKLYGFIGYGLAHVLIQFTNFALYWKIKQIISVKLLRLFIPSGCALIGSVLLSQFIKSMFNIHILSLQLVVLSSITFLLYLGGLLAVYRGEIIKETSSVLKYLKTIP